MVQLGHYQKGILVRSDINKKSLSLISYILVIIIASLSQIVYANNCGSNIRFAFFNGVQTTPSEANRALEEFKRLHGENFLSTKITYSVLYNYSNDFEDFVETFEQRLQEQEGILAGRFELFLEALNGGGPWWSKITESLSSTASILGGYVDWYQAKAIELLTSQLGNPPLFENYIDHRKEIDEWIASNDRILFVAHSQGNLFANSAYDYVTARVNKDQIKVVHIAPASTYLNGNHSLADLDLVINGLRALGSAPEITKNIPGYLFRPAGVNGKKDILGHGLLEIYINQGVNISEDVYGHIESALSELNTFVPAMETASLIGTDLSLYTLAQATATSTPFITSFERIVQVSENIIEYPNVASLFNPETELPPNFLAALVDVSINVEKDYIEIDFDNSAPYTLFASGYENTYVFTFNNNDNIVISNAEIDDNLTTLGLTPSDVTHECNQVSINVEGLSFTPNTYVRINLTPQKPY